MKQGFYEAAGAPPKAYATFLGITTAQTCAMQCNQNKDAKSGWGESDGNGRGGANGTSEGDCGSFLWSPTERRCKLHKTTAQILSPKPITTEATSYKDYIYCVRRKYTAHLFCLGLYRHPPMV